MPLPRVHLLMLSEMTFQVESLSTHVTLVPELLVRRRLMSFQGFRPSGAKATAFVGTSDLSSLVLVTRVLAKVAACRGSEAASLDGTDEASILLVNDFDMSLQVAFP